MSDCCSVDAQKKSKPVKCECPRNGNNYPEVQRKTVLQHIDKPWIHALKEQKYFYCDDPACEVVYFAEDNTLITTSQVRTHIGIKDHSNSALRCYCFGISNLEAQTQPEAKSFVIRQTKAALCSCITSNPSGRCCLKDFPKYNKE
ncbi:putative iron-sulfur cluster-binding metallochaperone [Sulfuriflexus mobilis]|uniref:putative iron-sulfur cluster-binding metallochaperone n=1 Tax=Sulfuriflexus mobilis TaxID=1811807 RepID=UPI000F818F0A